MGEPLIDFIPHLLEYNRYMKRKFFSSALLNCWLFVFLLYGCANNKEKSLPELEISPIRTFLVDSNPGTGGVKSLIFDKNCIPYIAYQDSSAGIVMLSYPENSTWETQQISEYDVSCIRGNQIRMILVKDNLFIFSLDNCDDYDAISVYWQENSKWKEKEILFSPTGTLLSFDVIEQKGILKIFSSSISNVATAQEIKVANLPYDQPSSIPEIKSLYLSSTLDYTPDNALEYINSFKAIKEDDERSHLFFKELSSDNIKHLVIAEDTITSSERPEWLQIKGERLNFTYLTKEEGFVASVTGGYIDKPILYKDGIVESENSYSIINNLQVFIPSSLYSPTSVYTIDYEIPISTPSKHGKYLDGVLDIKNNIFHIVYSDETSLRLTYIQGGYQNWKLEKVDPYFSRGYSSGSISVAQDSLGVIYILYRDENNENLRVIVNPDDFYFKAYEIYTLGIAGIEPSASSCGNRLGVTAGAIKYFSDQDLLDSVLYFFIVF